MKHARARSILHALAVMVLTSAPVFWSLPANAKSTEKAAAGAKSESQQARYEDLELFQRVLHYVESNYVEPVKNRDLIYGAIKGMLDTLDPHSNFLPPDVFRDMKIDTTGKFGGLGIEIGVSNGVLTVVAPIEDTPAWKAGLKPNDRIVKINGESTKGMTLSEAVAKMRGKKGTAVDLAIYRQGFSGIKDVKVTREDIKIQSVKSDELDPGFGYVRLSSFNEDAASDVKAAIAKLQRKHPLRGLVFDLRMNPGGLLDQAVDVSSLFIDDGVVVSTIGRNKDQKEVRYAHKGSAFKDFPVAVLVNSSTASAAEIVAGCLQDHHRAIIMGQPTFGKGSVQTVMPLGDDIGLKLTIARYYTPSGRSIQDKGVQPDILLDEFDPKILAKARIKQDDFRERDLKNHMLNPDGEDDSDALKDSSSEGDYTTQELQALDKDDGAAHGGAKKAPAAMKLSDDDMTPVKFDPRDDYQVKEALNYLKSYQIFHKMALDDDSGTKTADLKP